MKIPISIEKKAKYYPTLHELSVPLKSAFDLMANFNLILEYGLGRLNYGMHEWAEVDRFPSFDYKDPYDPYDMKDLYFATTNAIYVRARDQQDPWKILPSSLGEIYFSYMLRRIKEYENLRKNGKKTRYQFNKGMVYANLGVMQADQKKMDEGFANILKALDEDRGYSEPEARRYALFRRELFTQFEKKYVIRDLSTYANRLRLKKKSEIPQFVDDFLESLTADQRSFFDYNFVRIMQNLEIWNDKENRFTSNRLLVYCRDLCLFAEDLLRRKGFKGRTLGRLLENAFQEIRNLGSRALDDCGAESLGQLSKNLRSHFKTKNPNIRSLKILLTLRNFSSHNISGGTRSSYFYREYEKILMEIFGALFKIHTLPGKLRCLP